MLTEAELLALIALDESDRVELTVSTKDTDKFSEAVCAFANDLPAHGKPGYLIIGVDKQRRFSREPITNEFLGNLGALRSNGNIQPLPMLTVEKVSTGQGDVAVVTVEPSELPPVRYQGRVCIRIGPRRGFATEQEERRLVERRVAHALTFDAQPCLGSAIGDLALSLFLWDYRPHAVAREVIEANNRPIEQQLSSLRFLDPRSGAPTNAGILLFGVDVRRWLPGAWISFLVFDGADLAANPVLESEMSGDLLSVLRKLDALLDAQLARSPVAASLLTERIVEAYPGVAVRELVLNAVMHRDYQATAPLRITWFTDRLEIQSPGGLYGVATRENFPRQTSYRNPVLAEALKCLGYVNRYGRGVLRAQDALQRNGSAPAEFEFDDHFVLARIRRRS
jgi:ATP-dependent DNA helicase RecG